MSPQFSIDFQIHEKENNRSSQESFDENKKHFCEQANILFQALMRGEVIGGDIAREKYLIKHLPSRSRDLRNAGVSVSQRVIPFTHGSVELFMTAEQIESNKIKFNLILTY